MNHAHSRKLFTEFIGTAFLLATVVGSGIMAERLAGGNIAIALLGNTIPTGAILVVLIVVLKIQCILGIKKEKKRKCNIIII